ncbi:MAG: hydantoinase/oxoprolinase family protein [Candidatus Bipolaricaulota bacterium]|nr:hydantoinase/oxoprolinase family protein [Candidatus Bipolaricaulota bacterium]
MAQAIGIDIGGTFVDVVIADETGMRIAKEPSTPGDPAVGVLRALDRLMASGSINPAVVSGIVHGCTVATNALLEGKWARTALVTTRGFRDVLEIGRQNRSSLYDLDAVRPPAIVPRDLRFEVTERTTSAGEIDVPLDLADVRDVGSRIERAGVAAVAVAFLFSYLRPEHERIVRRLLEEHLGVPVILSSDVLPEIREFERTSTTVLSAALRPVIGAYLAALEDGAAERGLPRGWRVMQSSGAVTTAERAQDQPASLLLSGPAGGVQGARAVGAAMGERNLITMDMGGTSCDVSLVTGGEIERTQRGAVGSYPVALPMVSVHTIGAGGGSVAWVDRGGALRVGPESMGAHPGPACYGRGGRATVTDAHLVLGHLAGDLALGGLPELEMESARTAVQEEVGRPLGLSVERAALGILEVADAAMERTIRVVTVERGRDPRDYALLAFGGAGPLHGAAIARRLGMSRVVIPRAAGVLSALGLIVAETGHDYSRSLVAPLARLDGARVAAILGELRARGADTLRGEGIRDADMQFIASADVRYVGQSHELTVPLDVFGGSADVAELRRAFERAHEARYGHGSPDEAAELVTLRLRAQGPALVGAGQCVVRSEAEKRLDRAHRFWLDASGPVPGRMCSRDALERGADFRGPLVIVGDDATILVPSEASGHCDRAGNILLEVGRDAKNHD